MTELLPRRPAPPAIRRLCLAVDIESYSKRSIPAQVDLQTRLLWTMTQACKVAGVKPARCDRQDSGDGQILILPSSIDESKVLPGLVLGLLTAVRRANESPGSGGRLRLRISLGQGAIQVGATGFASRAVITVARLLDSAQLRAALAADPAADAAVVVTNDLYQDMFAQGYGGLPADQFHEVQIQIPAKGFTATAWIHVPVNPPLLLKVPVFPDMAALARRQQRMRDAGAAAAMAWAAFAGGRVLLGAAAEAGTGPRHGGGQHAPAGHGTGFDPPHQAAATDDHPAHDLPGHHGPDYDWLEHQHRADEHGHVDHDHGHIDHGHIDHGHVHLSSGGSDGGDSDESPNRASLRPYANDFGPGHDSWHDGRDLGHDAAAWNPAGHSGPGHDGFASQVLSVDTAYGYDANGYLDAGGYQDPYDSHDTRGDHHAWGQHMPGTDMHGGSHA